MYKTNHRIRKRSLNPPAQTMGSRKSIDQIRPRQQPPSLLACVACRRRHLKCNGETPICKRCQSNGTSCNYEQSRRGYKGPRKTKTAPQRSGREPEINETNENTDFESHRATTGSYLDPIVNPNQASFANWSLPGVPPMDIHIDESAFMTVDFPESVYQNFPEPVPIADFDNMQSLKDERDRELAPVREGDSVQSGGSPGVHSTGDSPAAGASYGYQPSRHDSGVGFGGTDSLIDIFYHNFFSAHPFIIPMQLYRTMPGLLLPHLRTVVSFVACHFAKGYPQQSLRNAAEDITSDHIPDDGFKVQGLMLFGMCLFARCEQEPALVVMNQAIDLALELGMNTKNFSLGHAVGNPMLEESWRRTWWELYMIDGILASLSSVQHQMRLHNVPTDVPLPCKDETYAQCKPIPPLRSRLDFLERAFAFQECDYSSLAYKIESVRLLGKVISIGPDIAACTSEQVGSLDASLANFFLSLPQNKRSPISLDGRIDEVLFSAQNIIDCAQIMLHRPRSNLVFVRNHYPTPCTRQESIGSPISPYEIHTSKAVKAANSLSSAAALRSPLAMHSPCFVCAIAMAAVVHLPAYSMETNLERASAIKERLQLSISALNSISEVWPTAGAAKLQISQFAREIFAGRAAAVGHEQSAQQIQQINIESMMDDQTWLDRLGETPGDGDMTAAQGNAGIRQQPAVAMPNHVNTLASSVSPSHNGARGW